MKSINTNPKPLISCIMPTNNRRAFVPHAIGYFLQQDYANKELVIVDDGTDSIEDLVPDNKQIRYIRLDQKMKLGQKRNYCVRESKADLIMHWDDDDWMAPYRISYQVTELLKNKTEVCGLQQMLFREIVSGKCWLYKYPANAQPWLAGGSLLYTRSFWQLSPFPDLQVASDTSFIFAHKLASYTVLQDHNFYVASIHDKNTSPKKTNNNLWHPVSPQTIQDAISKGGIINLNNNNLNLLKHPTEINIKQNGIAKENKVTACLLSYKRPGNIQKIIESLHPYSFINEIIVWNNNPASKLNLQGSKVRVVNAAENMICYGRFLCAALARNDIIYFQDDDAIVKNVQELYQVFLKDDSCITHALAPRHFQFRNKYYFSSGHVALLGWGSFIQKKWLAILSDYLVENENDYLFRREADKFFSLLLGKNNNTIQAKIDLLDHDSTPGVALYLENDHNLYIALAVRKALAYNRRCSQLFPTAWNIVITCLNYAHFLDEAVRSVLYNHADYTITIVDDASTDDTIEVCKRLQKQYPFIKYIRNEQTKGAAYSRNRGVAATDSIFVILLDADDKIGPDYLYEAEKLLRQGCDVVNPEAILFGNVVSRWTVPDIVTLPMQLKKNNVHCCSAFRRSYWEQVGGMDENMIVWEDYEFWIKLAQDGARIKRLPGNHFYYRKHGTGKSGRVEEKKKAAEYILSKYKHLFTKS